jgi:hypothetical protein
MAVLADLDSGFVPRMRLWLDLALVNAVAQGILCSLGSPVCSRPAMAISPLSPPLVPAISSTSSGTAAQALESVPFLAQAQLNLLMH